MRLSITEKLRRAATALDYIGSLSNCIEGLVERRVNGLIVLIPLKKRQISNFLTRFYRLELSSVFTFYEKALVHEGNRLNQSQFTKLIL